MQETIKRISLEELQQVAASDSSYFVLIQAMRCYAGISVMSLVASIDDSKNHKIYYALNPGSTANTNKFAKAYIELFNNLISKLEQKVETDSNLDSVEFAKVTETVKAKHQAAYEEYLEKKVERKGFASLDERHEHLLAMSQIDNLQDLLKAMRNYFDLTLEEIAAVISSNSNVSLTYGRIAQFEDKDFIGCNGRTSIISEMYLRVLITFYRALAPLNDDLSDHQLIQTELDRLVPLRNKELSLKLEQEIGETADQHARTFPEYLAYLMLETGHNYESLGIKNPSKIVSLAEYNEIAEKLLEPLSESGRDISAFEFHKLEQAFLKQKTALTSPTKLKKWADNFEQLVIENINDDSAPEKWKRAVALYSKQPTKVSLYGTGIKKDVQGVAAGDKGSRKVSKTEWVTPEPDLSGQLSEILRDGTVLSAIERIMKSQNAISKRTGERT